MLMPMDITGTVDSDNDDGCDVENDPNRVEKLRLTTATMTTGNNGSVSMTRNSPTRRTVSTTQNKSGSTTMTALSPALAPLPHHHRPNNTTTRRLWLYHLVDWIQQQRIPKSWIIMRSTRRSSNKSSATATTAMVVDVIGSDDDNNNNNNNNNSTRIDDNDNDNGNNDDDNGAVFWLQGVDAVLFGKAACSETVLIAGWKPPRYLWYMISGAMCDVLQLALDVTLHVVAHIDDATLCWVCSFAGSIVFRHTFHRYLVFGDYVGGYWRSLARMYAGYSVIIVLSTIFNFLMTRMVSVSHYVAYICTLLWTGIANYFILKKMWTFGGSSVLTSSNSSIRQ